MRQALGPGALGRPRGSGWRGRWEGGSGWGTHVNPWLIHVNVWQKPLQYCKVMSLQLIKKKERLDGLALPRPLETPSSTCLPCHLGPGNPAEAQRAAPVLRVGEPLALAAGTRAELLSACLLPWVSEPPGPLRRRVPSPLASRLAPAFYTPPPAWPRLPGASRKQESRSFPGFPPFPGGSGHHLGSGSLGAQQPPRWTVFSGGSGFASDSLWVGTCASGLCKASLSSWRPPRSLCAM